MNVRAFETADQCEVYKPVYRALFTKAQNNDAARVLL